LNSFAAFIVVSTVLLASSAGNIATARATVQDASNNNLPFPYSTEISTADIANTAIANAARSAHGTKLQPVQIGVAESSDIKRRYINWLNTRGCDPKEFSLTLFTPENQLRAKVRSGDLTAVNPLALKLIWDGNRDSRVEAKQLLHEAILRGSTCALGTHNYYLLEAEQGIRTVYGDAHGKKWVKYSLAIPKTEQQKVRNIMNAYAWDLVYEMRTGLPTTLGEASTEFTLRYHDVAFQPTAADYQNACARANRIYQTLQNEREAQGLGSFDDTPPPMNPPLVALVEAINKMMTKNQHKTSDTERFVGGVSHITRDESSVETGSHCTHWPVPKTRWTLAKLHELQSDGKIQSNLVWIPITPNSQPAETNP